MEARTKKKVILGSTIAAAAIIALIAFGTFAYPALSQTTTTTPTTDQDYRYKFGPQERPGRFRNGNGFCAEQTNALSTVTIPVGTTYHVTSIDGEAIISGTNETSTASADLDVKVTDQFQAGYTVEVTGTITIGDTTYTITSANGLIGPWGRHSGIQGYADGSDGTQAHFLMGGEGVMKFQDRSYVKLQSEFKADQTYILRLLATVTQ